MLLNGSKIFILDLIFETRIPLTCLFMYLTGVTGGAILFRLIL